MKHGEVSMSPTRAKTLLFVVIGTAVIAAVVSLTIARTIKLTPEPSRGAENQLSLPHGPVQNVRFTLYDAGIFPQQQHARPGNVTIRIEDRTHRSAGLVVQTETGGIAAVIGQVTPVLDHTRGSTQFSLGAGNYSVFDASQPNNRAELVIEP